MVVGNRGPCVDAACSMPVLDCQAGTVLRSKGCAIIRSLSCCTGSGGCNQNAGARRASSLGANHFSVFIAGSFVVLSVRMAVSMPSCLGDSGVSSCVSVQLWSPQPPHRVYLPHHFILSPKLLRVSGMEVPPVFKRYER